MIEETAAAGGDNRTDAEFALVLLYNRERRYADALRVLDNLHRRYPRLKAYVLDDQGRLRKHIAIFIDGVMTPRERALNRPLAGSSHIYVFQALSGG